MTALSESGKEGTASGPKRRVRMDKSDRRHDLVEATISVLARKGYSNFTLADVAEEARVSPALVIVHFGSKDGLLLDVLATMGRNYFACLHASQVGISGGPAARLWSLVTAEFNESYFTPRYLAAWRTFWAETNGRKPYLQLFADQTRHFTELTVKLCEELIAEGGYPAHEATTIARLIDSALGGMWVDLTQGPMPLSIAEARHMAKALLALLFPRHFTVTGPHATPLSSVY